MESFHCFLDWGVWVEAMDLKQVGVVEIQFLQTIFHASSNVFARKAVSVDISPVILLFLRHEERFLETETNRCKKMAWRF
jgi:hypothetical protein